jgi:ribose 1,5-bisphosphokinase PhnN
MMIWTPIFFKSAGESVFTVAWVATGMKFGVGTS